MSLGRITGGDITGIARASEVERLAFVEIMRTYRSMDGGPNDEGKNFILTRFEFRFGDEGWWPKEPQDLSADLQLDYNSGPGAISKALAECDLYLANVQLIYPAVRVQTTSNADGEQTSAVHCGWGDLYEPKKKRK